MKTLFFSIILPLFLCCISCSDGNDSSSSNGNGTVVFNDITYNVIGGSHLLDGQTRLISFSSFSNNNRQFSGNIYYNTVSDFAELVFNEVSDQGVNTAVNSTCDPNSSNPQGLVNPNISLSTNNTISIDETFQVCVIDGSANITGPFDLIINIPSL